MIRESLPVLVTVAPGSGHLEEDALAGRVARGGGRDDCGWGRGLLFWTLAVWETVLDGTSLRRVAAEKDFVAGLESPLTPFTRNSSNKIALPVTRRTFRRMNSPSFAERISISPNRVSLWKNERWMSPAGRPGSVTAPSSSGTPSLSRISAMVTRISATGSSVSRWHLTVTGGSNWELGRVRRSRVVASCMMFLIRLEMHPTPFEPEIKRRSRLRYHRVHCGKTAEGNSADFTSTSAFLVSTPSA